MVMRAVGNRPGVHYHRYMSIRIGVGLSPLHLISAKLVSNCTEPSSSDTLFTSHTAGISARFISIRHILVHTISRLIVSQFNLLIANKQLLYIGWVGGTDPKLDPCCAACKQGIGAGGCRTVGNQLSRNEMQRRESNPNSN
eukprot:sb/3474226/